MKFKRTLLASTMVLAGMVACTNEEKPDANFEGFCDKSGHCVFDASSSIAFKGNPIISYKYIVDGDNEHAITVNPQAKDTAGEDSLGYTEDQQAVNTVSNTQYDAGSKNLLGLTEDGKAHSVKLIVESKHHQKSTITKEIVEVDNVDQSGDIRGGFIVSDMDNQSVTKNFRITANMPGPHPHAIFKFGDGKSINVPKDTGTGIVFEHKYVKSGNYVAHLEVTDGEGVTTTYFNSFTVDGSILFDGLMRSNLLDFTAYSEGDTTYPFVSSGKLLIFFSKKSGIDYSLSENSLRNVKVMGKVYSANESPTAYDIAIPAAELSSFKTYDDFNKLSNVELIFKDDSTSDMHIDAPDLGHKVTEAFNKVREEYMSKNIHFNIYVNFLFPALELRTDNNQYYPNTYISFKFVNANFTYEGIQYFSNQTYIDEANSYRNAYEYPTGQAGTAIIGKNERADGTNLYDVMRDSGIAAHANITIAPIEGPTKFCVLDVCKSIQFNFNNIELVKRAPEPMGNAIVIGDAFNTNLSSVDLV